MAASHPIPKNIAPLCALRQSSESGAKPEKRSRGLLGDGGLIEKASPMVEPPRGRPRSSEFGSTFVWS